MEPQLCGGVESSFAVNEERGGNGRGLFLVVASTNKGAAGVAGAGPTSTNPLLQLPGCFSNVSAKISTAMSQRACHADAVRSSLQHVKRDFEFKSRLTVSQNAKPADTNDDRINE